MAELCAFASCQRIHPDQAGGVAQPVEPLSAVSITAWPGRAAALATALELPLPESGRWTEAGGLVAVWSGPDHWWLQRVGTAPLLPALLPVAAEYAALIDMSDARAVLRVSGPDVPEMLARLLPIDLHPRAFGPGHAASTVAAHLAVQVRQLELTSYELSCARSYAGSLWRALHLAGRGRLRLE